MILKKVLINTYPQNNWPEKLEKLQKRFSDVEQGLNWAEKLEKLRKRFSDAEQGLIKPILRTIGQDSWRNSGSESLMLNMA